MITAKEARDLIKSDERIEKIVEEEIINAAKLGERSVKIEFPFIVTVSAFGPVMKQLIENDFQVYRRSSDFNKRYVTYITVTW